MVSKLDRLMDELIKREHQRSMPDVVRTRIDETLNALPKKRVSTRRNWVLVGAVAMTLLLGIALGSGFISPTMAKTLSRLPLLGSVFEEFGDTGLKQSAEQGLIAEVGKQVQVGKDRLEVKQVLYDGERLTVGFIWKSKEKKEMPDFDYKINGRETGMGFSLKGGEKEDGMAHLILDIHLNKDLPDAFTLNFLVYDRAVKGQRSKLLAQLDIPVKKAESEGTKYKLNQIERWGETTLKVKELSIGPSATRLLVERRHKGLWDDVAQWSRVDYTLIDSRGIVLEPIDHRGSGKTGVSFDRLTFAPPSQPDQTYFTVVYRETDRQATDVVSADSEVPFQQPTPEQPVKVPLGEAGTIVVNRIEWLPDQTKVHYRIDAKTPWYDPFRYRFSLELKDQRGKKYHFIDVQVEDPDHYSFVMKLKPLKKEEIKFFVVPKVVANPKVRKHLFRVELPKGNKHEAKSHSID